MKLRDMKIPSYTNSSPTPRTTNEWIKDVILATAIVGVVSLAIWDYTSIPYVEYSQFNSVCLAVIPSSAGDCDNMPERYIPVIVATPGAHIK